MQTLEGEGRVIVRRHARAQRPCSTGDTSTYHAAPLPAPSPRQSRPRTHPRGYLGEALPARHGEARGAKATSGPGARAGGASGFGYAASGGAAAAGRRALRAGAGGRGVRYRGMCAPRTGGVGGVRARRAGGQLFLGTCEASSAAAFARTQPWRLRKRLRLSWGCAFTTLGARKRVTDRQRHGAEAQTPRYVPGAKASREDPLSACGARSLARLLAAPGAHFRVMAPLNGTRKAFRPIDTAIGPTPKP